MKKQPTTPGSRATRNRRIKNWHIWLSIWLLVMVGVVYANYRVFGPNASWEPVSENEVGAVVKPSASPKPSPSPSPKASDSPSPTPKTSATQAPASKATPRAIDKSVRVVVYRSTVSQRSAARTADQAKSLGWNVVQLADWQGSVPGSTVYFSAGFEPEARALAKDLGIARVAPKHSGITLTGLSVVLHS